MTDETLQDAVRREASDSAVAAAAVLGIRDVRCALLPDNQFDTIPLLHIVRHIETAAARVRPDLVFTHFAGDLNRDHQLAHRATMTAFRPLPGCKPTQLLGFEVLSSTEYAPPGMGASFHPTVYIDVTEFLAAKQKALAAYASEMRPWPHPRSHEAVETLARLRGSQCGREAAEGFVLYRGIF
jgi:LmbE family N-acetylglucosaminyl deacetylase